jgi:hypothetical protein
MPFLVRVLLSADQKPTKITHNRPKLQQLGGNHQKTARKNRQMATKRIQTTEIVESEQSHPAEILELKKETGQNWETFEANIDKFLGRDFALQFPANFMDMENSAKTVSLDYAYQRANAHGQILSAYLKSYMETAGHHVVDMKCKGKYFGRLPYRLDVLRAYVSPNRPTAPINQTQQANNSYGPPSSGLDFQGIAALMTALKPEPTPDNTPILLEMIRSNETRAREDMKSMLSAFKSEMQQLKENSLSPNDIIDNMRELKELQKEFTSAPQSVQNKFQKLTNGEATPTNWVELAKYAVDKVAPNMAGLTTKQAAPINGQPGEDLTPEDLVNIKRTDIIGALSSDRWAADKVTAEVVELIVLARKHQLLHLVPELFNNHYDIYKAIDDLLTNCGSDEYRDLLAESIKQHALYQHLKGINLNGSAETPDIDGDKASQKIRFA